MWGDSPNHQHKNEENASLKKFEIIQNGIQILNRNNEFELITLREIVNKSTTSWIETEWEFPKGRRDYDEKDLDCALREFEEETGLSSKSICIVENLLPFEEMFIGSNHKSYKHKYFLAYMGNDDMNIKEEMEGELSNFQTSEVSKLEWKTVEECLACIRPYNLEKKQLISNIYKILQEYRLYS
jgi:8-oxo-dGTP pyrophosphatase MutT (NUDIX family)